MLNILKRKKKEKKIGTALLSNDEKWYVIFRSDEESFINDGKTRAIKISKFPIINSKKYSLLEGDNLEFEIVDEFAKIIKIINNGN
jgi:hypothetical protein